MLSLHTPSILKKAAFLNQGENICGSFAEIGAGQEVARYFFQAGQASHTVAKTMSAYDMAVSDSIYGKSNRYVSKERLTQMLNHEYRLIIDRLVSRKESSCRFFAFANTVATSKEVNASHGWVGIRFQVKPQQEPNDIMIHVRLKDKLRLNQQEAMGALGVNLIYGAFRSFDNEETLVSTLLDNLTTSRMEIDYISVSGDGLKHLNNHLLALQLTKQNFTSAALFSPKGQVVLSSDCLFKKNVLIQKGVFRPVTKVSVEISQQGLKQLQKLNQIKKDQCFSVMEISLAHIEDTNISLKLLEDILHRVEILNYLGYHCLVSNHKYYFELKEYLRKCTDQHIAIVMGATHLEKIFDERLYAQEKEGILYAFGSLFDEKTAIYVYPYKTEQICKTSKTLFFQDALKHLYQYLIERQYILDITDCGDIDTSILAVEVTKRLLAGDPSWESFVPKTVIPLIKKNLLPKNFKG